MDHTRLPTCIHSPRSIYLGQPAKYRRNLGENPAVLKLQVLPNVGYEIDPEFLK